MQGKLYTIDHDFELCPGGEKILKGAKIVGYGNILIVSPSHIINLPNNEPPIYDFDSLSKQISEVEPPVWDLDLANETCCLIDTRKIKETLENK